MPWAAAAAAGGAILSYTASGKASDQAAAGGKDAMMMQMQNMQLLSKMLKPYREAGKLGIGGQLALLGLSGADAQQSAISGLEKSPMFTSLVKSGENSILQNASATGGLRGGNTQAALAEFRPQMLANVIESQYSKLSGLSALGENAAAQTGNNMQQGASNVSNLMSQIGQTQAQGTIAQGQAYQDMIGQISKLGGQKGWF